MLINLEENLMGIDEDKTRMSSDVQARGRNHLLVVFAEGSANISRFVTRQSTVARNFVSFNCDLRPDQG